LLLAVLELNKSLLVRLLCFLMVALKQIQLFLEVCDFLFRMLKLVLVAANFVNFLLQTLDVQFHLLLTPDMVATLSLELTQNFLILSVGFRDGSLRVFAFSLGLRLVRL